MNPADRFQRRLIRAREALFDRLLAVDRTEVLNHAPSTGNPLSPQALIESLRATIERAQAEAISGDGLTVNYQRLAESESYRHYRRDLAPQLRALPLHALRDDAQRIAFWVNLYNLLVMDAVIAYQVQRTVAEGWLGALRFFRRAAYLVDGQRFALDDIEHGILRANRGHPFIPGAHLAQGNPRLGHVLEHFDPRLHFALNCASRSCPPIRLYTPERLDSQLALATQNFLASEVEVDRAQSELRLSSIFRWYAGDFGGAAGVRHFIARHHPDADAREWLAGPGARAPLRYQPYDWGLNRH